MTWSRKLTGLAKAKYLEKQRMYSYSKGRKCESCGARIANHTAGELCCKCHKRPRSPNGAFLAPPAEDLGKGMIITPWTKDKLGLVRYITRR